MKSAPKLDRRIVLIEPGPTSSDTSGQPRFSNPIEHEIWAARRDITRLAVSEQAQTILSRPETRFIIRWRAGVDTTWSLRDADGKNFSIDGVGEKHGRRRFLELAAVQIGA